MNVGKGIERWIRTVVNSDVSSAYCKVRGGEVGVAKAVFR